MKKTANKISGKWIRETRDLFLDFLDDTGLHEPERNDEHAPKFYYIGWLIMFTASMSVNLQLKSYVQIHKMSVKSEINSPTPGVIAFQPTTLPPR